MGPMSLLSTFYFTSTEARWLIRDVDGGGWGGGGDERVKVRPRILPEKDRRDRGASPLPSNSCFNCRAWAESQRTMSVALLLRNNSKRNKSKTFAAQLHLLTHDLFWANLKVQLHLPPLDLLIF